MLVAVIANGCGLDANYVVADAFVCLGELCSSHLSK
jgi:hypothetical protein